MFYIILYPNRDLRGEGQETYQAMYTNDPVRVSKCIKDKDVKVFKIDPSTEVNTVDVTCNVITGDGENVSIRVS